MPFAEKFKKKKKDRSSTNSLEPVPQEASQPYQNLAPWEAWLLKLFPVHLLNPRQYIDLALMSIASSIWLSFFHVHWWGVENAFVKIVFYATSLHLILLANAIKVHLKEKELSFFDRETLIKGLTGLGCGFFLVILTVWGVGQEYRILADETNLLGSAMSLYIDQTYQNITEGTFYYDSFHITERVIDKRPPLFSYLIAVCHFLFGYRSSHGFLVNALIAFTSGVTFFYIGKKYVGNLFGIMVVICYASIPIVMIGMGSSGFEVMTALFNTLVVWRTIEFLKTPTSKQLELLLLCLLAAAQGRYESVILALPVGLAILARLRKITWHPTALRLLVIPYLFIPLNWQKHITSSINGGDPEETITFSLTYFWKHLKQFWNFWVDWKQAAYPSNLAITAAAVAGAMILAINVFKNRKKMDDHRHHTLRWALALSVLAAACIIGAQLCYYMGDIAEPAMQRFAIAYAPAIAFPAAYFFWRCYLWTRQSLFIPGCLVIVFFLGMSIAGRNPLGKTLVLFREYKSFLNFVQQFPVPGTLVVTGRPGMFTVHGYGAISHETFTNRAKEWKTNMERKLFTNVVMEEFIHYDQVKNPRQELPPEFHTETLYEYQNDAEYYVRFSRILVKDDTGKTSTVNPASVKPNGEPTEKGALSKDVFKTDTKSLFGTTKSLFHW